MMIDIYSKGLTRAIGKVLLIKTDQNLCYSKFFFLLLYHMTPKICERSYEGQGFMVLGFIIYNHTNIS